MSDTKTLSVTKQQAELILDSFKCSNDVTRDLALKAASLVLEFEAESAVNQAEKLVEGSKYGPYTRS